MCRYKIDASKKQSLQVLIIAILLPLVFYLLYIHNFKTRSEPNSCKLYLSVLHNDTGEFYTYPIKSNNSKVQFSVLNLDGVKIAINEEMISLSDALYMQYITIDELSAFVRDDARNGMCIESYRSDDGLTEFIYTYPDYEFCIIYDVLSTPSEIIKIENYLLCRPGDYKSIKHSFKDETGKNILSNNNVTFKVEHASSSGIKIQYDIFDVSKCDKLKIEYYSIRNISQHNFYPVKNDTSMLAIQSTINDIENCFVIDWSRIYGNIDSGLYELILDVNEISGDNINSRNLYSLEFSIG